MNSSREKVCIQFKNFEFQFTKLKRYLYCYSSCKFTKIPESLKSKICFHIFILHSQFFLAVVLSVLPKVTVKEGENVTLPCNTTIQGGTLYQTTWFKGTQKLMVIKTANVPGLPPSIYKYSQRKNPYHLVGQQSLRLSGVDRYDHGNYTCTAMYLLHNFDFKTVKEDVMLLVKGENKNESFFTILTSAQAIHCLSGYKNVNSES